MHFALRISIRNIEKWSLKIDLDCNRNIDRSKEKMVAIYPNAVEPPHWHWMYIKPNHWLYKSFKWGICPAIGSVLDHFKLNTIRKERRKKMDIIFGIFYRIFLMPPTNSKLIMCSSTNVNITHFRFHKYFSTVRSYTYTYLF